MVDNNTKELSKFEEDKLQVWLAEYDACQQNRNHFDSVRWLIGSIFVAISFTLLGLSFQNEIAENLSYVSALTFLSIFLMLIWFSYNLIIQRYISITYERMWAIEQNIKELKLDIQLHTNIKDKVAKGRGQLLFYITIIVFMLFCAIRIAVFF